MYQGSILRIAASIGAVKHHLSLSEVLRGYLAEGKLRCVAQEPCFDSQKLVASTPDKTEWKIIDHCSAVTRLYAIYEQFAHELIREYMTFLEKNFLFAELGQGFRSNYRSGIGRILDKKDGPRYQSIILEDIVRDFNLALTGDKSYRLEPSAMLMQEQNLRLPELARMFANCGIDGMSDWIAGHPDMRQFFKDQSRLASGPENEMVRLIDYRNEAAHGGLSVNDVVGLDLLVEFADFVVLVCKVIAERVQRAVIDRAQTIGLASHCGKIANRLKDGTVILAPVTGHFRKGQAVYLVGANYCVERRIISIQVDSVEHEEIAVPDKTELGFGLDAPVRKGAAIFLMSI